jgi:hypothetical protein
MSFLSQKQVCDTRLYEDYATSCFTKLNEWINDNTEQFENLLKNLKEKNRLRYYSSSIDFFFV